MSARNYAGGNWKDTQRSAEQYWRDTKGGWVGGPGLACVGLGGCCKGWACCG